MCFNRTISACAGGGRAGQGSRTANSNGQTCVLKGRQLIHRCLCAPLAAAKNYPPAAEPAPLSAGSRKVVRDARSIYLDVSRVSHPSSQMFRLASHVSFPRAVMRCRPKARHKYQHLCFLPVFGRHLSRQEVSHQARRHHYPRQPVQSLQACAALEVFGQ